MKNHFSTVGLSMVLLTTCLLASNTALASTRILLIGDSLSSGYGLSGPGWVEQANQALSDQGHDVEIINDSISGDTTAGGVTRIGDSISRTNPDWVMIELGGNDGLRGLSPKEIEGNLQKMVDIASDLGIKTLILGIYMPPNYGKAYTDMFAQTYVNVAERSGSPLLPLFIGEVGGDPSLNQADQIHPNDAAQPIIRDRVLQFLKQALELESR